MSTMLAPQHHGDPEPIVAIEYHRHGKGGWKPHSVATTRSQFDFNWCEQDGELCYHESGGGPEKDQYELSRYCAAPEIVCRLWVDRTHIKRVTFEGKDATPEVAKTAGYLIINEPIDGNPFEGDEARESDVEYCVVCHGYHPSESMCRHVNWAEDGGGYSLGCGASELSFAETQTSLYRLLRMLPDKAIDQMIKAKWGRGTFTTDSMLGGNCTIQIPGGPHIYCEPLGDQLDYEDRFWPGVAWLQSLDKKAREAIALNVGWLWQWKRKAWRDSCVKNDLTFCRRVPDIDKWLAIDPMDPSALHDQPYEVRFGFKPQVANDFAFLKDPKSVQEVTMWNAGKHVECGVTFSVAKVETYKDGARIFFGSVIERQLRGEESKHISAMEGYQLV